MRDGETVPYHLRISRVAVLEALERVRVAGGHRDATAAACAAILAADPVAPERARCEELDALALVLDLWGRVLERVGAPSCMGREALRVLAPAEERELAEGLRILERQPGPAAVRALTPRQLGGALGRLRGRRDGQGRRLTVAGLDRTGVARWTVAGVQRPEAGE